MKREAVRALVEKLARKAPSVLAPKGALDPELSAAIAGLAPASDEERAVQSALHLWNDELAVSHTLAQEIKSPTGSYLHGVMHRREPDYENSKYWFNQVGRHPVFEDVLAAARELAPSCRDAAVRKAVEGSKEWDPFRMVDWCQAGEPREFLEALQAREIAALARHCLTQAGL